MEYNTNRRKWKDNLSGVSFSRSCPQIKLRGPVSKLHPHPWVLLSSGHKKGQAAVTVCPSNAVVRWSLLASQLMYILDRPCLKS